MEGDRKIMPQTLSLPACGLMSVPATGQDHQRQVIQRAENMSFVRISLAGTQQKKEGQKMGWTRPVRKEWSEIFKLLTERKPYQPRTLCL